MKPVSSLSIVTLAYNEEENVRWALPQLLKLLDSVTDDGEIVFVTHAKSIDGTNTFLAEQHSKDPRVRFEHQPPGVKGYGPAFAHGLKHLRKEFAFHVDIDGQFLFDDLHRAIDIQKKTDADFVHFNRKNRQDPVERKVIGFCFKLLVHTLYSAPVWDFDSAFKLFRTHFAKTIRLESTSGMAVPEFIIRAKQLGARIEVGSTQHQPRRAGKPLWEVKKKFVPIILPNFDIVKANLKDLWRLRKSLGARVIGNL